MGACVEVGRCVTLFVQRKCDILLDTVCTDNGKKYYPGQSFPSSDGCNTW